MYGFVTHAIRGNQLLTRALKPHTRKHQCSVRILEAGAGVECSGTSWDGGSRSHYEHLLPSGHVRAISVPTAPPQFGGGEAPTVKPDQGGAILRTGTFCGKTSTPTLYLSAEAAVLFGVAS